MRRFTMFPALLAMIVMGGTASANDDSYVRVQQGETAGDAALQCAVGHFTHPDTGAEIVLYGVVHIADASYYAAVQEDLDSYTTVLYEGVAPGSEAPTEADRSLGELQQAMGDMLGLTFQKDGINYTRANLRHADMNMDQLKEAMGGGSISPFGNMLDGEQMARMAPMLRMFASFGKTMMDGNPAMRDRLKLQFANQLGNQDLSAGLGEEATQAILYDRNAVVMDVLADQLSQQNDGTIAIFYGAAHMPDFIERLTALGWQPTTKRWMSAWTIGNGVGEAPATTVAPTTPATPAPATPAPATPEGPRWF